MFTGIIETTGVVKDIISREGNIDFIISSPISRELKIDQSVSHNGVCLTVVQCDEEKHTVTAITETLRKSNLGDLKKGDSVNLERCMKMNDRLDGHIVQGHVDQTGDCIGLEQEDGSFLFTFNYSPSRENLIVEKGSICVNGISLTAFNCSQNQFTVAIIPYTFEHTNIKQIKIGDKVNLEFDVIGKYVSRLMEFKF